MKSRSIACLAFLFGMIPAVAQDAATTPPATDWLLAPDSFKARVIEDNAQQRLILDNGLARRVFLLGPNAATIDL